jgi:arabinofuranosyltransferase
MSSMHVDTGRIVAVCLVAIFSVELIRTAWLCDDAYITLRTVDNVVSGYGPRWNVVERVQAYTHPLWMLVLVVPYSLTHEAYFTTLFVSMVFSLAAVWLLAARVACSWQTALIGGTALIFSKAFVDYSTSGLENPLTHLLLALAFMFTSGSAPRHRWAWLVAGLAMVNRLDLGLLVLPAVVARSWELPWRRAVSAAAIGLAPVILWEAFSIVYYGFPFPNTAYAKLQTGVSQAALVRQGLLYLLDSIEHDPVTLGATLTFILVTVARPGRRWPWATGILLYTSYVVWIGGDFMSGRFLGVVLFTASAMFAQINWGMPAPAAFAVCMFIGALGLFATVRPPMTTTAFGSSWADSDQGNGITDERAFYYRHTGLLEWRADRPLPDKSEATQGKTLRATGAPQLISHTNIGFLGYFAGPRVHIVDHYALADALLARQPARPESRIGHYDRGLPVGYVQTLQTGRNAIADPGVAMQYEQLRLITQGPLMSRRRWRAIWRMNVRQLLVQPSQSDQNLR